jgi:folate-binding protein YgfZ
VGPKVDEALNALGAGPLLPPDTTAVPGPKFAAGSVPPRPTASYSVASLPDLGGWARRMPYGADLLVRRGTEADLVEAAGVPLAGLWAFEALRVADRRPRFGFETDHRTLPAEVGWTAPAVHLDKGCYRGQETIARVHHLGRPPRRLVLLHLDGITTEELPARGTAVTTPEGRQVGFIGTAARHYELGMIALALVRQNVADDAPLRVGEAAAAIDPGE